MSEGNPAQLYFNEDLSSPNSESSFEDDCGDVDENVAMDFKASVNQTAQKNENWKKDVL